MHLFTGICSYSKNFKPKWNGLMHLITDNMQPFTDLSQLTTGFCQSDTEFIYQKSGFCHLSDGLIK